MPSRRKRRVEGVFQKVRVFCLVEPVLARPGGVLTKNSKLPLAARGKYYLAGAKSTSHLDALLFALPMH